MIQALLEDALSIRDLGMRLEPLSIWRFLLSCAALDIATELVLPGALLSRGAAKKRFSDR